MWRNKKSRRGQLMSRALHFFFLIFSPSSLFLIWHGKIFTMYVKGAYVLRALNVCPAEFVNLSFFAHTTEQSQMVRTWKSRVVCDFAKLSQNLRICQENIPHTFLSLSWRIVNLLCSKFIRMIWMFQFVTSSNFLLRSDFKW